MLDLGFMWSDLFQFGLLAVSVFFFFLYSGIALIHLVLTVLLVLLRRHAAWFLLPFLIGLVPGAVAYIQSTVTQHLSDVYWSGSTSPSMIATAEQAVIRHCHRISVAGYIITACLVTLTGAGAVIGAAVRARALKVSHEIAGDIADSRSVSGVAPAQTKPVPQTVSKTTGCGRCFAWIGASWSAMVLLNVLFGLILGWASRDMGSNQALFFGVPAIALFGTIGVLIVLCIWSARLCRALFGPRAVLAAFTLSFLQVVIAVPVFIICLVVGYGIGGGPFH